MIDIILLIGLFVIYFNFGSPAWAPMNKKKWIQAIILAGAFGASYIFFESPARTIINIVIFIAYVVWSIIMYKRNEKI